MKAIDQAVWRFKAADWRKKVIGKELAESLRDNPEWIEVFAASSWDACCTEYLCAREGLWRQIVRVYHSVDRAIEEFRRLQR